MKQVLQDRSGTTVVRDVPQPACPPGSVLVRNAFSAISSGTERSRVELSQKSLLAKARERPDLVREVINRARREGIGATRAAVKQKLAQETAVGYSSAGVVIEVGEAVDRLRAGRPRRVRRRRPREPRRDRQRAGQSLRARAATRWRSRSAR